MYVVATTSRGGKLPGWLSTPPGLNNPSLIKLVGLNANPSVAWSINWGSSDSDITAGGAFDSSSNSIYVFGSTRATFDGTAVNGSTYDGWITKYSAGGSRLWTLTYGGNGDDFINSVMVAPNGNLLVVGTTKSTGWPVSSWTNQGFNDIFMMRLNANGSVIDSVVSGTTSDEGLIEAIMDTTDSSGRTAYVFGFSGGTLFPGASTRSPNGSPYFVAKLSIRKYRMIWMMFD
jgi:hypothetical protein